MTTKRRNFSPDFKAKVALAAIRGDADREAEIKAPQAKIGELIVERDFLAKALLGEQGETARHDRQGASDVEHYAAMRIDQL